jgi:hypothetical protein
MIEYLTDKTKSLVCLVNIRTTENHLFCGASVFKGGLTGTISVYNGATSYLIVVPEDIKNLANYQAKSDPDNNIAIKIYHD